MKPDRPILIALLLFTFLTIATSAAAATITATSTQLNAEQNLWQMDYTVDGLDTAITNGFTIYFDYKDYENITLTSGLSGWDTWVSDPDSILDAEQEPGILDAAAEYNSGVMSVNFSITFNWLGNSVPADQDFELYLSYTDGNGSEIFNIVSSGMVSQVPVPASFLLLVSGLSGICFIRNRKMN